VDRLLQHSTAIVGRLRRAFGVQCFDAHPSFHQQLIRDPKVEIHLRRVERCEGELRLQDQLDDGAAQVTAIGVQLEQGGGVENVGAGSVDQRHVRGWPLAVLQSEELQCTVKIL
jgi:hypothetical protein